ncbi:IS4 family transposase [Thauera propionica]|uniref:IS4 family transposase n=1 Tax=Thauera propionica TaxID=2019431 RepID=A0A235EXT0_9RHOO|nr:IS4 family transposase [Thauera propionica]OYD53842.1 IS4 family transposase [Thauera propionica]
MRTVDKHAPGRRAQDETHAWIDHELAGCEFKDRRLGQRLRTLLVQLSDGPGRSLPVACQDWANTKAAYRFLGNERVSEGEILAGHFSATRERVAATRGPVLVVHDTTELSYRRQDIEPIGVLCKSHTRSYGGRPRLHTVCGILMHSSLVVTPEGLPLGLGAIKFWTRSRFKGTNALKRSINPTRVPIEEKESVRWLENVRQSTALLAEPARCIHVGDRESDIYELFCLAQATGTHFLVRICVDRLAIDGARTIESEMAGAPCLGLHRVEVPDQQGKTCEAVLEVKCRRLRVLPPIGKQRRYPALMLTVLHATEHGTPVGRERIEWKLLTDLPVTSCAEAVEKLDWYALRWRIETFHKILKSGCRAEAARLRTAPRLTNLIAVFCILSGRIFWMTLISRVAPGAAPSLAFTAIEIQLLDRLGDRRASCNKHGRGPPLSSYVIRLARLGGYLARASDPPPGNTVVWRGMSRLTDIQIGFALGVESVDN